MALNRRQKRMYIDTANVYRMQRDTSGASSGDPVYHIHLTALQGKFCPTQNFDQAIPGGLGQKKEDNIFTANPWHCDIGSDIISGDKFNFSAIPTEAAAPWYTAIAAPRRWPGISGRVNVLEILLIPTTAPPIV